MKVSYWVESLKDDEISLREATEENDPKLCAAITECIASGMRLLDTYRRLRGKHLQLSTGTYSTLCWCVFLLVFFPFPRFSPDLWVSPGSCRNLTAIWLHGCVPPK